MGDGVTPFDPEASGQKGNNNRGIKKPENIKCFQVYDLAKQAQ